MRAGIALGTNMGDRLESLRTARRAITQLTGTSPPARVSPVYETDPVDCEPGAGTFWNAVMEIGFDGSPIELLQQMKAIEASMGRPAVHPRNVSRPIDLDLLYFGDAMIHENDLELPHPRMFSRKFVLQPLADIRPDLILPGQARTVQDLLAQTKGSAKVVALPEQWA